jgi:hypothetical protein
VAKTTWKQHQSQARARAGRYAELYAWWLFSLPVARGKESCARNRTEESGADRGLMGPWLATG